MSSPIHKYLFSPPPSPPRRPSELPTITIERAGRLHTLKSILLPEDIIPRNSFEGGNELKPRSPRTPQNRQFTLDNTFPSAYPRSSSRVSSPRTGFQDVEATPRGFLPSSPEPSTPKQSYKSEKLVASPPYVASNVPSSPLPIPSAIPRPLLRLLLLASLVLSSILLLVFVPSARLPSLRGASVARRLALAPDGRAYIDVGNPVRGWLESQERDYVPAVVRSSRMMKRSSKPIRAPAPALPPSHELLALQSYLLQNNFNTLPSTTDTSKPLDVNTILSFAHGRDRASVLAEIEAERAKEVVVWHGLDGKDQHPQELVDALSSYLPGTPTLIPCHKRPDLHLLREVLARLGHQHTHPIVFVHNKPIVASAEVVKSGKLAVMLEALGIARKAEVVDAVKVEWKPKFAKPGKRSVDEVEQALKEARAAEREATLEKS